MITKPNQLSEATIATLHEISFAAGGRTLQINRNAAVSMAKEVLQFISATETEPSFTPGTYCEATFNKDDLLTKPLQQVIEESAQATETAPYESCKCDVKYSHKHDPSCKRPDYSYLLQQPISATETAPTPIEPIIRPNFPMLPLPGVVEYAERRLKDEMIDKLNEVIARVNELIGAKK